MRALAPFLPLLFCAVPMLLCMKMMSRGSKSGASCHDDQEKQQGTSTELAELHEEVTRLRAEVRLRDRDSEPSA